MGKQIPVRDVRYLSKRDVSLAPRQPFTVCSCLEIKDGLSDYEMEIVGEGLIKGNFLLDLFARDLMPIAQHFNGQIDKWKFPFKVFVSTRDITNKKGEQKKAWLLEVLK